jgi:hypothetical protein
MDMHERLAAQIAKALMAEDWERAADLIRARDAIVDYLEARARALDQEGEDDGE